MNCPKCGLRTLPDQKFCRSCGNTLQIITQPLAKHATVSHLERTPAIILKAETQRANSLTLWGFIIMFIGVAIGIIGKMLMHEEMVTVVGVLVSLVGMFLTVYPYLSPSPRPKDEVEEILFGKLHVRRAQKGHVKGEDLYTAYGQTDGGRYLIIGLTQLNEESTTYGRSQIR